MKKLIALFLAVLLLSTTAAFAADEIDLTTYTDEELEALKVQVAEEIRSRLLTEAPESPAADLHYASNGVEVRINDYKGEGGDVYIPDEIDGVPVTQIYKGAFRDSKIKSIRLPEGLTSISSRAFNGTRNIKDVVVIPKSVQKIGDAAFYYSCVPGVVIQSDCTIGASCFGSTDYLEFVYVRKDCKIVFNSSLSWGDYCFNGSKIKTLVLPADVKFQDNTLADCKSLTVYCPAGSATEQYCKDNFIVCNTADYEAMVAYYEALYFPE